MRPDIDERLRTWEEAMCEENAQLRAEVERLRELKKLLNITKALLDDANAEIERLTRS